MMVLGLFQPPVRPWTRKFLRIHGRVPLAPMRRVPSRERISDSTPVQLLSFDDPARSVCCIRRTENISSRVCCRYFDVGESQSTFSATNLQDRVAQLAARVRARTHVLWSRKMKMSDSRWLHLLAGTLIIRRRGRNSRRFLVTSPARTPRYSPGRGF